FFAALTKGIRGSVARRIDALREWREERRREQQRREVIAKHTKNGVVAGGDAAVVRPAKKRDTRNAESGAPPEGIAAKASRAMAKAFSREERDEDDAPVPAAIPAVSGPKSFA